MEHPIKKLFDNEEIILKVKNKLPYLFQIAEIESSRSGKVGMQVGSLRENIINALLAYVFGEEHVNTDIPITANEVDVELYNIPLSIKTFTGKGFSGVKLVWTVDRESALNFARKYYPSCDIIFIRINWNDFGELCFIPLSVQRNIFKNMGFDNYLKLPTPGTNPRGVEISKEALKAITSEPDVFKIEIYWAKQDFDINPYERWIDYWAE